MSAAEATSSAGAASAGRERERPQEPFKLVSPVLRASLLIGSGGGFLLAAILTVTQALHLAVAAWWSALVQAHGHLQLYGWAALFVIGVSFHKGVPPGTPGFIQGRKAAPSGSLPGVDMAASSLLSCA